MSIRITHRLIASFAFGLALTAGTAALPHSGSAAIAQLPNPFTRAAFDPPPGQNAPGSTAGGGSRPSELTCMGQSREQLQAIALAPRPFVGLSTQAQPTVWLYLSTPGVESLEVSLFSRQLKGLSQQTVEIADAVGPVPISLSDSVKLAPGETYYWSAAIPCNPNRRTEDWIVGGWIQHQPLATGDAQTVETLTDIEKANHYLKTGYWYDALGSLLALTGNTLPADITATNTSLDVASESARNSLTGRQQTGVETDFEEIWGSLLQQANLIDKPM